MSAAIVRVVVSRDDLLLVQRHLIQLTAQWLCSQLQLMRAYPILPNNVVLSNNSFYISPKHDFKPNGPSLLSTARLTCRIDTGNAANAVDAEIEVAQLLADLGYVYPIEIGRLVAAYARPFPTTFRSSWQVDVVYIPGHPLRDTIRAVLELDIVGPERVYVSATQLNTVSSTPTAQTSPGGATGTINLLAAQKSDVVVETAVWKTTPGDRSCIDLMRECLSFLCPFVARDSHVTTGLTPKESTDGNAFVQVGLAGFVGWFFPLQQQTPQQTPLIWDCVSCDEIARWMKLVSYETAIPSPPQRAVSRMAAAFQNAALSRSFLQLQSPPIPIPITKRNVKR